MAINPYIKTIRSFLSPYYRWFRANILKDPFYIAYNKWIKDQGDSTLRFNYPLTDKSIVFDLGGYLGEWSEKIADLYNPYIYIFEPVPQYYAKIAQKFKDNPKVSIYNFGLSSKNKNLSIALLENSSSVYKRSRDNITIQLRDISEFVKNEKITNIDLIKINIEGEEYNLLEKMIDKGLINLCDNIQVQFHNFISNAKDRRDKIREHLLKTHFITYDYPFVFENWQRKKK